ncbi:hypothetical protein K488DRAFT_73986 [Vararia minispora EC-137]|uniref:Uncharacterized protein n=1 Tax=Vararia minispora EC-137 TaxID=1314806 RepID=A0ACB8Q8M2_9AGAM|nr:hypothetical protein K488DRAFT_73986 [Vararia minispora EC-137]
MPSLRRSFSTPAVRSTPYPLSALVGAVRGHPRRPSSASETSTRRVLADIDWWRVTEGQCEPAPAEVVVQEEPEEEEEDVDARPPLEPGAGPPRAPASAQVTPGSSTDEDGDGESGVPAASFLLASGVLLERPTTPVRTVDISPQLAFRAPSGYALRVPIRRHASESSVESLDSSPDLPLTPREHFSFFDPGFAASEDDVFPIDSAVLRAFDGNKAAPAGLSMFTNNILHQHDLFA